MIDHVPRTIAVEKPWGKFEQYTHNMPSTVKVMTVRPVKRFLFNTTTVATNYGWLWTQERKLR